MDVKHLTSFAAPVILFALLATCYEKNEKSMVPKENDIWVVFFSHNGALKCVIAEQIHRVNKSSGVAQEIRC